MRALGRSLASNYFYYRRLQRVLNWLGKPEYLLVFNSDVIRLNLIALLNQYASMAKEWSFQPVVILVPRNRFDTSSASKFIAQYRSEIDSSLLMGDLAEFEGVDWMKFNYQEKVGNKICHPSPYGYQIIAEYIAGFMQENAAWPPP